MRTSFQRLVVRATALTIAVAGPVAFCRPDPQPENILASYQDETQYGGLTISYPQNETLFPPEIVPPTFRWQDANAGSDIWLVTIKFRDDKGRMNFLTHAPEWTPSAADWDAIKKRSREQEAQVAILGVNRSAPAKILSGNRLTIQTSKDEVGAPIFYREVNLPFSEAVKDPTKIRWRCGAISSPQQPPVILEKLPVCGNCHSFSADAKTLAMDVDYANSKGSYIIVPTAQEMTLATSDIITWDNYKREDKEQTFGLLSQISPDGNSVVSTVKDRSVFVPKPDLAFSQLFFPLKGILCVYNRTTKTFQALPGADDPQFVQSNPSWSPDGKYIVFARTKAYKLQRLRGGNQILLSPEECDEFLKEGKTFLYDLYRIPFNGGEGGKPEPLAGASNNGMSNFFARYSPDGKWIVFCKAKSFMLLQPDSELYIMPAQGGTPTRLRCNTTRMNSWHSWSPNSKWLVFSSKAYSPYTQLFLTHIDEQGRSTPPVLLSNFTAPDRAANIPEFVNLPPAGAIKTIHENFLDDNSYVRAADAFYRAGDVDNAIREYEHALKLNPNNFRAHQRLGFLLYNAKQLSKEGIFHLLQALTLDPSDPLTRYDLGLAMAHEGQYDAAITHLSAALQMIPEGFGRDYSPYEMRYNLGGALLMTGKTEEALVHLTEAVRLEPNKAEPRYVLALALARQGKIEETVEQYAKAVSLQPEVDQSFVLHNLMGINYAKAGRFGEAIQSAEKAIKLARATGHAAEAQPIQQRIEFYKQNLNRKK